MIYLIVVFLTFLLHLILKLNWIMTGVTLVFLLLMLFVHKRWNKRQKIQQKRFFEASSYMDTMLYAFLKEGKIEDALSDVLLSLPEGELYDTVQKALSHLRLTFDDAKLMQNALAIIENAYPCSRICNIHEFMLHVEFYGGQMDKPIQLLLADKNQWEKRVRVAMYERKKLFTNIVMSIASSVAICGMVLYLPVMNVDISTNWITQLLAVVLIVLDDVILYGAQRYMAVDWLTIDVPDTKVDYAKKMKEFVEYNVCKERRLSWILGGICAAVAVVFGVLRMQWFFALALLIGIVCLNQHRIGYALKKKNLTREIERAFPNWLLDLVLLLQSENVLVALTKSKVHVPVVLKEELEQLVARLDVAPESARPYHAFLDKFNLPEVYSSMSMLYALSAGNSGNANQQVAELIEKNQRMLEVAEAERLKDKNSGMYLLFLAPVLSASLKMVVDMAVFMLQFLSTSTTVV